MVSNFDIAKAYAEGKTKGKGSNMFIDGNAIYSYGTHFPMAVRLRNGVYLFNTDSFSVSTSKHQGYVQSALAGAKLIEADTATLTKAVEQGAESVVEIERKREPQDFNELNEMLVKFFKSKGLGRYSHTRTKKFIEEMKGLATIQKL